MTPWYVLASVPVITAIIGYVTNWTAIKMIFWPEQFIGIRPIGWQGVLPGKAQKFANDVATTMTREVMSAREFAQRLDPPPTPQLLEHPLNVPGGDMEQRGVGEHAVESTVRERQLEKILSQYLAARRFACDLTKFGGRVQPNVLMAHVHKSA